jgi:acetoin utilization deacetylase AcuC-like enzyme
VDGTPSGMEVDGMDPAEKRFEQQTLTGSRGRAMQAFRPKRATKLDMTKFHTDEYIDLLEHVNPDNAEVLTGNGTRCERLCNLHPWRSSLRLQLKRGHVNQS